MPATVISCVAAWHCWSRDLLACCPLPPLQLSVLRLFEAMLSDVSIRRSAEHQPLLAFARGIVRNLFSRWALLRFDFPGS
jgi:hypothetical protein